MNIKRFVFNSIFLIAFLYAIYEILFIFAPNFTQASKIVWAAPIAGSIGLLYTALKAQDLSFEKNNLCAEIFMPLILTLLGGGATIYLAGLKSAVCFIFGGISIILIYFLSSLFSCAKEKDFHSSLKSSAISLICSMSIPLIFIPSLFVYSKNLEYLAGYAAGAALAGIIAITSKVIINPKRDNTCILAVQAASILSSGIVGASILGFIIIDLMGAYIPFTLCAMALFCAILGIGIVQRFYKNNAYRILNITACAGILLFVGVCSYLFRKVFLPDFKGIQICVLLGIILGLFFDLISNRIAKKALCENGCKCQGIFSVFLPLGAISIVSMLGFLEIGGMESYNAGALGIGLILIAAVITYVINSITGFFGLKSEDNFEKTLYTGNKGVMAGVSTLCALVLLIAWALTIDVEDLDILNPFVLFSLVFGASIPCFFNGIIKAIARLSGSVPKLAVLSTLPAILTLAMAALVPFWINCKFGGITLSAQSMGGILTGLILSSAIVSIRAVNDDNAPDWLPYTTVTLANLAATLVLVCTPLFVK